MDVDNKLSYLKQTDQADQHLWSLFVELFWHDHPKHFPFIITQLQQSVSSIKFLHESSKVSSYFSINVFDRKRY